MFARHLQPPIGGVYGQDLPCSQQPGVLDHQLAEQAQTNHHDVVAQLMLAAADAILGDLAHPNQVTFFVRHPLRDAQELVGRGNHILPMGPADRNPVSSRTSLTSRPRATTRPARL